MNSQALKMACGHLIGTLWLRICVLHVMYFNQRGDQDAMDWWSEHRFDYDIKPPPIPGRLL